MRPPGPATRMFTLTLLDPPALRPGGSPDAADGIFWPTVGRRWTGDLAALEQLLTQARPGQGKFACPFFLVGAFTGDERRNAAFERASVVALDVEGGPTTQVAHQRFLDVHHVLYTTWRHRPEAHRFRLVFPLARDVSSVEFRLLWTLLARRLGAGVDALTKDLARALFLPAIRPDGGRAAAKAWEAPLLDPDAVLQEALALVPPVPRPAARPCPPSDPVRLPWDAAARLARHRLNTDPGARLRAAEHLQAVLRGGRATGARCPGCGRPSVWFWLEPDRMKGARCNHRNSCGWWGPLDRLLDAAGEGPARG